LHVSVSCAVTATQVALRIGVVFNVSVDEAEVVIGTEKL